MENRTHGGHKRTDSTRSASRGAVYSHPVKCRDSATMPQKAAIPNIAHPHGVSLSLVMSMSPGMPCDGRGESCSTELSGFLVVGRIEVLTAAAPRLERAVARRERQAPARAAPVWWRPRPPVATALRAPSPEKPGDAHASTSDRGRMGAAPGTTRNTLALGAVLVGQGALRWGLVASPTRYCAQPPDPCRLARNVGARPSAAVWRRRSRDTCSWRRCGLGPRDAVRPRQITRPMLGKPDARPGGTFCRAISPIDQTFEKSMIVAYGAAETREGNSARGDQCRREQCKMGRGQHSLTIMGYFPARKTILSRYRRKSPIRYRRTC